MRVKPKWGDRTSVTAPGYLVTCCFQLSQLQTIYGLKETFTKRYNIVERTNKAE